MSTDAAKLYMHTMIFSHFSYCIPVWLHATNTLLQPSLSLYTQALTIMDKQTTYCNKVKKSFLSLKITTCIAGPGTTSASSTGDCHVAFRSTTSGQNCFSVNAGGM